MFLSQENKGARTFFVEAFVWWHSRWMNIRRLIDDIQKKAIEVESTRALQGSRLRNEHCIVKILGKDTNDGFSEDTAWQTIAKINTSNF